MAQLSALLQVAFDRLTCEAVIDYFRSEKLDVKLLKNLKMRMLAINQVIDDAENKETTDLAVKDWLDELKDVIFDAEDVFDVIATQALEKEVSSTTLWNPFDRSLPQQLEDVFDRIQSLFEQKDVFGLKPSTRSNSTSENFRMPTTSLVEQSSVYGRDDDKDEIKKLLLYNDDVSNGDVIAIVGMGGLGKTTLAQLIFDDYEINGEFKSNKVWICVAEDFDVIKITKTILEKLTSQSYATNDLDLLQLRLRATLLGKKFLIALDDVWNENYSNWDNLQKPFASAAPGSKILVTTRSEKVASVMRATSTYKLEPLPDEACWSLFSKHAFENIHSIVYSKFEALGRELVKKCGGLPLAAKVLGGLVGTKQGYEEWREVLKSEIWDLSDEGSDNNILSVLRLSYHYLPSNLKRCFSFCSIVPKDFHFRRETLVLLWMAENLLQDSKSKRRRIDVGYEYLRELESRSLIQPSTQGELYFSMHDLVNDLAKSVSGDFYKNFDPETSFNGGEKTRHFSYEMTHDVYDLTRFKGISEAKRLRTFLPLVLQGTLIFSELWSQLNVLRSLTLPRVGIEKLPDSIGNLKLLRYLDLSRNDKIIQLPESVASLYNLKVLNLSGCRCLTKLPSEMRQLIKLNYLNIEDTNLKEMPLQMGRLKDLDVLTDFVVGKGSGSSIAELKDLKYLRGDLHIHGLENVTHPEDALEANLNRKSYLEELYLDFGIIGSEDARILLANLRPHVNLKKLSIYSYSGTRLPDWSGKYNSFINLVNIEVREFKHCFDLSPLGQLPSLKFLLIERCDSLVTLIPVELPNDDYFAALVYLRIEKCPKLKLPQQNYRFTSLEDFSLIYGSCASLQFFPLSLFPKLKELTLEDLESIESLAVIDEANNFNLQYLESINILTCPKLKFFPVSLFPNLKELFLNDLKSIESLAVIDEANNFNLQYLESIDISICPKLKFFPLSSFPNLRELVLYNLESIESLAVIDEANKFNLQYLESIYISTCPNLKFFSLSLFPKLRELTLHHLESIESLAVIDEANNFNLKELSLLDLESIFIINCPKLKFFPVTLFPKAKYLQIDGCKNLIENSSSWGLQKMLSLSTLRIGNFDLESFPEEGLLLSSLSTLEIREVPNLTNLNGKSLQLLTCLKELELRNCPKLQCLPEEGLPTSLSTLNIWNCPLLNSRCEREQGEDWSNIAHIPNISIS